MLRKFSSIYKLSKCYYSTDKYGNIIKEVIKTIDPSSNITITSAVPLKIRPYDLLNCPASNILHAKIYANSESQFDDIEVNIKGKDVEVINTAKADENAQVICYLEVPVKSDLNVVSSGSVSISEMYSDHILVRATESIQTKNLRSTSVDLGTENGNVQCDGLLLAHKLDIHAKNNGNIRLDKLQGDLMHCKSFGGDIYTNCCYVESSKFVTEGGSLFLKNIHKSSEVYVLNNGTLDMTGIHGNVYVKSNGGNIKLQFSEITGDNIIMANDSETVFINISDIIEESSFIQIHSDAIILDESVSHLSDCLMDNGKSFRLGKEEDNSKKLLICTKGILTLGKMSWAESMKLVMGLKDM